MSTSELLISSDSHAQISHEKVKVHLASKHHAAYDAAAAAFAAQMSQGVGKLNQAWQTERKSKGEAANAFRMRNMGRDGHADGAARLADMDTDGVAQEVIYCEVSGFRYLYLVEGAAQEATIAFNDAMHEYGAADPNRLIVSYQIPIHEIDWAIAEVQRVAAMGGKSLQLPVYPPEVGLPDYYHERYDPLFAAIQETGMPICLHIGLNTMLAGLQQRDPTPGGAVYVPMVGLSTGEAIGMFVLTGIFERFPRLKVVFVEPGLTWIAWWLATADDMATRQRYELPELKEIPSYYFHRNVFATFIDESDPFKADVIRHRIGVENIMWSSDYPHPVSSWPNSRALVNEMFKEIPDSERELIVSGNAKRVWNL